jgi:hypothetical protein
MEWAAEAFSVFNLLAMRNGRVVVPAKPRFAAICQ